MSFRGSEATEESAPSPPSAPLGAWGTDCHVAALLAMTEEGTIPGKKNRETITEMLVRVVWRHRRPRNDRGCDEVHSKDDTERVREVTIR